MFSTCTTETVDLVKSTCWVVVKSNMCTRHEAAHFFFFKVQVQQPRCISGSVLYPVPKTELYEKVCVQHVPKTADHYKRNAFSVKDSRCSWRVSSWIWTSRQYNTGTRDKHTNKQTVQHRVAMYRRHRGRLGSPQDESQPNKQISTPVSLKSWGFWNKFLDLTCLVTKRAALHEECIIQC